MSNQVRFSRHARRRAKLYGLPETEIRFHLETVQLRGGRQEVTVLLPALSLPLKLIVDVSDGIITVVSNYPLKKGRGQ